ncbi:MAG: gliding motility-associated ABC transporter substrate-binding protein GldG [Bacteroidota bacterium]
MFALLKKEVRGFLSSLIGYVVVSIFLLLLGLFLWTFTSSPFNIPLMGMSDLGPFFTFAPLVFLFLVPAITMRSFAEEKRTGTIELLFTRPLTDFSILFAKYLAAFLLVFISLIPTLLYYYSIYRLGDPPGNIDSGATWGSYIGLLMLAAGFVSIGIFSSVITQNQIIAFIIGVFLCFFLYLGFNYLGSFSLFGKYDGFIKSLGIYSHYQSISRGVVDTRDIIYFISLIFTFLLVSQLILQSRRKSGKLLFVISLAIVLLANFISTHRFVRYDLTAEKRYTLTPTTIEYLEKNVNDQLHFTIYLTGELPSELKVLEEEIRLKLDEFASYIGENIQYEFFDPYSIEGEDERNMFMDELYRLKKLNYTEMEFEENGKLSFKYVFPSGIISYKGQQFPIRFFHKKSIRSDEDLTQLAEGVINNLEFVMMDAIRNATRESKPRIAVLEGHGEANGDELYDIEYFLNQFYVVERIKIQKVIRDTMRFDIHALRNFNCLLVVQPDTAFDEKEKFVIDQFIMKGGKVAWFVDQMDVNEDTLFVKGQVYASEKKLKLDDMLFTYGVRINKDMLVDRSSAPLKIPGYPKGWHPWYYFPLILPEQNHAITRNINPVKSEYASTIDTVGDDPGMKKTVLLKSSPESYFSRNPVRINYGIIEMDQVNWVPSKLKPGRPVAVLLEGTFKSVFNNRLSPEFESSPDYTFVKESRPNKMLVVSDGDIIMNDFEKIPDPKTGEMVTKHIPLYYDKYEIVAPDGQAAYLYGNREFVLNAIDYLLGDDLLLNIRQRTITLRKLNNEKVVTERSKWQFVNVYMPIMMFILFGIVQGIFRKRKYTR